MTGLLDRTEGSRAEGEARAGRGGAVRERLRRETAELHARLDRGLAFLIAPSLEMERYRAVLATFYGWYSVLEPRLLGWQATAGVGLPPLSRVELLERDLRALGYASDALAALPRCRDLGQLDDAARWVGCTYVIEGSSLGGQVIARAVEGSLGLTPMNAISFFSGEGMGVAQRWRMVLAWLETWGGPDIDEIVEGARETFASLLRWGHLRGLFPP